MYFIFIITILGILIGIISDSITIIETFKKENEDVVIYYNCEINYKSCVKSI